MRISSGGVQRRNEPFVFTFEGQRITGYPGESLAAALIAGGVLTFRKTRSAAGRGPFCGMGVCGECRVNIGGESRRACMEPARADIEVALSPALAAAVPGDAAMSTPGENWRELAADVLVIGAGPAGLSAARVAAGAGLDVLVVDERRKAGGQYFKQPADGFLVDESALDEQFTEGLQLLRATQSSGAKLMMGATVWAAFAPDAIAVAADGRTILIKPKRLILATGAYERAVPIPGWTLPGVMTTGSAQTLLRAYQTVPGRRVLIAGNGPLNMQVAHELVKAGAQVVAIAESAAAPYFAAPSALLSMASLAPRVLLAGMTQVIGLRRHGVPIHYRHALVSVEGDTQAKRAALAAIDSTGNVVAGTEKTYEVDAVCVNHGFLPQNELARALGCAFRFDSRSASVVAQRGDDGRSSVEGVFIVGDAGGMRGARVALAQGALAGAAVAADLRPGHSTQGCADWLKALHRHQRFQDALWQLFAAPPLTTQLAQAGTLICRCEEIDRATIESSLGDYAANFGVLKRATRLGMGQCQGRYCTTLCADLMTRRFAIQPAAEDFFAPRAPVKPVPVEQLAGDAGEAPAAVDILRTDGRDTNIRLDRPDAPTAP